MQIVIYKVTGKGRGLFKKAEDYRDYNTIRLKNIVHVVGVLEPASYFQISEYLMSCAADEGRSTIWRNFYSALYTYLDEVLTDAIDEGYIEVEIMSVMKKRLRNRALLEIDSKL